MPRVKEYFVNINTNRFKTIFYTGSTDHLIRRAWQHKNKLIDGFTAKYNVDKLMYYEKHKNREEAVKREMQIKRRSRLKKINLIKTINPEMRDLSEELLVLKIKN
jgi:putative endonuclease